MVDILERLQSPQTSLGTVWPQPNLHEEAADEITRLREELASAKQAAAAYEAWKFPEDIQALTVENERLREETARLREVLAPFVDAGNFKVFISTAITKEECFVSINVKERDLRRARAAIREGGKDD